MQISDKAKLQVILAVLGLIFLQEVLSAMFGKVIGEPIGGFLLLVLIVAVIRHFVMKFIPAPGPVEITNENEASSN